MTGDEMLDRRIHFLGERLDEHIKEITQERNKALAEYEAALADKEVCVKKWERRDRIMNRIVWAGIASAAVSILLQVLQWCGVFK
jgi:hypothetical protein